MNAECDTITPNTVFVGQGKSLSFHPGLKAGHREDAYPGPAAEQRNLPAPACPCAGRACSGNVASAIGWATRRSSQRSTFNRQLRERIEQTKRLIISDMFLCLRGINRRQSETGSIGHNSFTRLELHQPQRHAPRSRKAA